MDGARQCQWVTSAQAVKTLGVCPRTLRRWDKEGKVVTRRTPGNHRLYDLQTVQGFGETSVPAVVSVSNIDILYARVSSAKQAADLERQIASLREKYPQHTVVQDIGSGINWKRRGLRKVLRLCMQGRVRQIVIAHRDRLSRLAFDLIEYIAAQTGASIVVDGKDDASTTTDELGEDLLSIIHVFSCRSYGRRKYGRKRKADAKATAGNDSKKVATNPRQTVQSGRAEVATNVGCE